MIKPWGGDNPPNYINDKEWVLQSPKSGIYIHVMLDEWHNAITRQAMGEIAEAMNELWEQRLMETIAQADVEKLRAENKRLRQAAEQEPRTEIRVIELTEVVEGLDHPHVEHRIQYRNGSGPWISLPVVRTYSREEYQRMKDGAHG
jgi:hypothetical protein